MFDMLNGFFSGFGQIMLVFSVALALLQCFSGYRLLKFWIGVIGFLAGFVLGFGISSSTIAGEAYLPAVIGLVAGIVLALVAFRLYIVGVLLYCGFMAFSAVQTISVPEGQGWNILLIVLGVAAFLGAGFLAAKFARPCIIAVTAVTGAFNAVNALRTLIPALGSDSMRILAGVVIAAMGMAVQFFTTRGAGRK